MTGQPIISEHARALLEGRVRALIRVDETCSICAASGRPCGGDVANCATMGCHACRGATWTIDELS